MRRITRRKFKNRAPAHKKTLTTPASPPSVVVEESARRLRSSFQDLSPGQEQVQRPQAPSDRPSFQQIHHRPVDLLLSHR